ncbi:MAG: type II toxin-antitoxin system Phd/YefM family antitoxin [Chloroflexi bacterium]|nr:MAG: type II toxin-antitoxin system Phd/YefM family antitoxin [Chloroflexota bacterium]
MARVVTAENLRARLGQELDSLKASSDVVYVSKRGRLAAVLIDVDRYADIVERLEFLEDSLAVLEARRDVEKAVPWKTVRRT